MKETGKKNTLPGILLKYAVPLIITIGLCYLMFTGIDFNEMIEIIRRDCNFSWIALALCISVMSHVFRAMRWRIQLQALGIEAPLSALILSIFGTYAVNLVFPRLGELWRTGYIAQRQKAQFTTVFGSMVADRLADTITVALLTLVTFLLASKVLITYFSDNTESIDRITAFATSPWLWLGIVAMAAFVWWFLTHKSANSRVIKLQRQVRELWNGFAVIITMPGKGRWLLLTAAVWGCYFVQLYVAFYAFPFTEAVLRQHGILAALVAFVLSSISMGVPSNGGIGPWQWAIIFALGIYGLEQAPAAAFANLVLGTQTLLLILLGVFTFTCIALEKKKTNNKI
ncbi:MAG: flippase-like domain-containing protein [Muribaculaceae bacterium]|nr:flippase-like domain-containing protein [Muribaculaceae bacterium]